MFCSIERFTSIIDIPGLACACIGVSTWCEHVPNNLTTLNDSVQQILQTCLYICTSALYISLTHMLVHISVVLVSKNLFSISYSFLNDERNQDFSFSYSMLPILDFSYSYSFCLKMQSILVTVTVTVIVIVIVLVTVMMCVLHVHSTIIIMLMPTQFPMLLIFINLYMNTPFPLILEQF